MQLIKEIGGGKHYWDVAREKCFAILPGDFFERKKTFGQGNKYLGNFVQMMKMGNWVIPK